MQWVFLGIIVGSLAFLAQVILGFLESYRERRAQNEEDQIHILRLEDQLKESEHARAEAEGRSAKLDEEGLLLEQRMAAISEKIRAILPPGQGASQKGSAGR